MTPTATTGRAAAPAGGSISAADFSYVSDLVRRRSAIVLETGKEYLVEARLTSLARELGIPSLAELVGRLRSGADRALADRVTEAMTTNETSFFRDIQPFDALRQHVLPDLVERRASSRKLSIWCAAASSGQEPYTIAMVLDEFPQLAGWDIEMLATDISTEMLERARQGRYSSLEVNRGLPATMLVRHFEKHGTEYQIKPHLQKLIDYRFMNLAAPWGLMPQFDIVFIRNVLIYFDVDTKRDILGRVKRVLRPDGYLFLGAAETTVNLDDGFERAPYERAGCYVRRGRQ